MKIYLDTNLKEESYFFQQRSRSVIERAEDILLSRRSENLKEFAEIIHSEIKEHDNPELLEGLRTLTTPFILESCFEEVK